MRHILVVLIAILTVGPQFGAEVQAQDVYFASIQTEGGRGLISGFLYRVNDSTVEILPGRIRKDIKKIHTMESLAIPIKVIRAVALRRVRPSVMVVLESTLISAGAAVLSIAITPNNPRQWLPVYAVLGFTMISAYSAILVKTYKPKDHFFREKLEDKCIVKDERSIAATSPLPEVR